MSKTTDEIINVGAGDLDKGKLRSPQQTNRELLIGDQEKAYTKLIDFVESGERMFCFEGFAGVGKSFCINMFIEEMIHKYGSCICAAAPTHKAKVVLQQMAEFKSDNLVYATVHSVLGLKPIITADGKETFTKDPKTKNSVEDYDYIIVDESSMLDDKLFYYLLDELDKHYQLKIIFVGDHKQLPPVNHSCSAPMDAERRRKHDIGHSCLTEIVRQKGTNPIIALSKEIREGKFQPESKTNEEGQGVIVVKKGNYKKVIGELFCSGKYEANPNFCRVVAWKNTTVDIFNNQIRNMIYEANIRKDLQGLKDKGLPQNEVIAVLKEKYPFFRKGKMLVLPKYIVGDKVIADKPIFNSEANAIVFQTNEEMIVLDLALDVRMHLGKHYQCYIAVVKNLYTGKTETIEICHESSTIEYNKEMERLKKEALQAKNPSQRRQKWITYYSLDKRFARLKYAPCLTTYKSQGSTYENIVIVADDIEQCHNRTQVLQHLYVGVTRASKRAFILK